MELQIYRSSRVLACVDTDVKGGRVDFPIRVSLLVYDVLYRPTHERRLVIT
jgi:hypothetical protein